MVVSPTTSPEKAIATIAAGSRARPPVISATITSTPIGAWAMAAKQAAMPTITNAT
jgi:hypothetical protein